LSDNAGLASAVTVANCLFCFVFCSSSSQLKHESNLDMLEREKIIDGNLYLDSAGCRGPHRARPGRTHLEISLGVLSFSFLSDVS